MYSICVSCMLNCGPLCGCGGVGGFSLSEGVVSWDEQRTTFGVCITLVTKTDRPVVVSMYAYNDKELNNKRSFSFVVLFLPLLGVG